MPGGITETGSQYSRPVGLVYIFNLIVGTGALTMPRAFSTAGWLLSLITIIVLSFMSFLTVTFITEAMSIANAILKDKQDNVTQHSTSINEDSDTSERKPLLSPVQTDIGNKHEQETPFEIRQRTELGQMASMFFNKFGIALFNLCIIIYLYGDLAIYAAAVPKSIRDISCTYKAPCDPVNSTVSTVCNRSSLVDSDPCWNNSHFSRMDMYRICVAGFFVVLGGFTFFNVQKTKYLQLFTTVSRWIAFAMMIVLALIRLKKGRGQGHPSIAEISGMPDLFGVCVYSFMCHHSLPSLITPIKNKQSLFKLIACDYILILLFYMLISFTGIYAFNDIQDIYTLNFFDTNDPENAITNVKFIQYFLALFPVFTLSTNFPIISITLRNNLKAIGYNEERPYTFFVDRIVFPLLALIPPMAIALGTNQVEFLVGITGSYAGAGIQYIIPALLVFYARRQTALLFPGKNNHASPFKGFLWVVFVCIWAVVCMVFVTVNHIVSAK